VGDRFQVTVVLDHDGSRMSVFPDEIPDPDRSPDLIGNLGDLELIRRQSAGSRLLAEGGRRDSVVYEATTFALDSAYAVPAGRLATETDTILVEGLAPIIVPVRSLVPADAAELKDLAPIVEFPRTWWPWLLALAIALATGAWLLHRRRNRPPVEEEPDAPSEPAESPLDEALRRLAGLTAVDYASAEEAKPFFTEVSDIARTYVARRLGVPAREMTTHETIRDLRNLPRQDAPSDAFVRDLRRILESSDIVKFADVQPAAGAARETVERTRSTLQQAEKDLRPSPDSPLPEQSSVPESA
jgi:hypothetical protein